MESTESIKEFIRRSEFFRDLDARQADKLAGLAEERTFTAGQYIFNEGEQLPYFFIVIKGSISLEIDIKIGTGTRRKAMIEVVGENGFVGWNTFINLPAPASGTALETSRVLLWETGPVHKLCEEDTDLGYKVLQEAIRVVSRRLAHTRRTLAYILSVASHDLRAPLATTQSVIEAVAGGYAGEVSLQQKKLLLRGKERIGGLLNMINNILDISYIDIQTADFQKVNLYGIIEDSISDVAGLAQPGEITVRNNASRQMPAISGASKKLQQALTNLLSNGIKFTPPGGSVTISSKETPDCIEIDVADTGIGIPEEDKPRIFNDFFRGFRAATEGAGLGLSIARKIIEAHGGRIWVQSPAPGTGKGSCFSFNLPKNDGKCDDKE